MIYWKSVLFVLSCLCFIGNKCNAELTPGVDCVRNCDENPDPKTCHYKFVVQQYEVQGIACKYCKPNVTNYVTNDCQCVQADGYQRTMIAVNRMMPGPAIYVCEGDRVVVDVINKHEGLDTTIHWHGMSQRGTQYYDGVPLVTQCPIASGTKFRYFFNADEAGTYFWHAHSGLQKAEGMIGSLVVFKPQSEDPHGHLYDFDTWETVMLIQDWKMLRFESVFPGVYWSPSAQDPNSLLVNGIGARNTDGILTLSNSSYAEFNVKQGFRYRFRMINALATVCPVSIQIHEHNLTVIATDHTNVEPFVVNTIVSMSGERYDFVVEANQDVSTYWIEVRGLGQCKNNGIFQMAILRYEGAEGTPTPPKLTEVLPDNIVLNPVTLNYTEITTESIRITQLHSLETDCPVMHLTPDRTFYIPIGMHIIRAAEQPSFFAVDRYEHYSVNLSPSLALVSNITFEPPTSPLISQFEDIDPSTLCSLNTCADPLYCSCTNILELELGEIVDLFIVDTIFFNELYHPVHIHGLKPYVLDIGFAKDFNVTTISAHNVKLAHESGALDHRTRNKKNIPVAKDTVAVPTNGYAHLRIVADNPGFWFMHCHIDVHMVVGMNMVFQVGNLSDLPPVPERFPRCGDFAPDVPDEETY